MFLLKNDKVIDFLNMTAYLFSALKMFRLQHQFNNIVETTQLKNDQMPEYHCHCKCSKCPPQLQGVTFLPHPVYKSGVMPQFLPLT